MGFREVESENTVKRLPGMPQAYPGPRGNRARTSTDGFFSTPFHTLGMEPCVFILASQRNGTLYVGMTANLVRRVHQHRTKQIRGFTAEHDVTRLVWFEPCPTLEAARFRETRIKRWRRAWKLALIENENPQWRDLFDDLTGRS